MKSDDHDLCVCFHVPRHKIIKFIRQNKPRYATQVSECYGAGTGCGWCIPFIRELHEAIIEGGEIPEESLTLDEYLAQRRAYHKKKKLIEGQDFPEEVANKAVKPVVPEVKSLTDEYDLKDSFDSDFKDRLEDDLT